MPRVKNRKSKTKKSKMIVSFWLLWSMSGSILFSFGLLALLNDNGSIIPVFIGAVMIFFAILLGTFTTETALAMKKR